MKLLTQEIRNQLPLLYSGEHVPTPLKKVIVKFFHPMSRWTFFAIEFDGDDTFFGYVIGQVAELGYFSLSELQSIQSPPMERDIYFKQGTLIEVLRREGWGETADELLDTYEMSFTYGFDPVSGSWVVGPKSDSGLIDPNLFISFYDNADEATAKALQLNGVKVPA